MLKRLWSNHRNACLLTLALLVISVVASPWVLLAAVLPLGWVLIKKEESQEDNPPDITDSAEVINAIEPLTGAVLLDKIKELGNVSKSDLVRACGYFSTKEGGGERLNYTVFYEALLEAKSVSGGESSITEEEPQEENNENSKDDDIEENKVLEKVLSRLDKDKTRVFKITVIETGGDFTCGIIEDTSEVEQVKQSIDDGDMGSYIDLPNGDSFDANSFNDEFAVYGPHVPGSKVLIEEAYGIAGGSGAMDPVDQDFIEIYEGPIEKSGIGTFMSSNPYPPEITEEQLIVYTKKYEKRIHNTFSLNIPKGEVFDPRDIYIGYMCMDETFFTNDEILEHFLYIPKKYLKAYLNEYLEDDTALDSDLVEEMGSLIDEIYSEAPDLAKKITQQHSITSIYCEGKGEWECDYLKIVDSSDEILHENGNY